MGGVHFEGVRNGFFLKYKQKAKKDELVTRLVWWLRMLKMLILNIFMKCRVINDCETHHLLHLLYLRQQPRGLQAPLNLLLHVGIEEVLLPPWVLRSHGQHYHHYYNLCQKSDVTSSRACAKALVLGSTVVNYL